jgi:hypothetical protein
MHDSLAPILCQRAAFKKVDEMYLLPMTSGLKQGVWEETIALLILDGQNGICHDMPVWDLHVVLCQGFLCTDSKDAQSVGRQ